MNVFCVFFFRMRRPPRTTRTATLFPYTTLFRSALVDRTQEKIVFMASPDGGMDIEKVAHETPERIKHVFVSPAAGLQPYQARELGFFLDLNKDQVEQFTKVLSGLYRIFTECDASLVERAEDHTSEHQSLMRN